MCEEIFKGKYVIIEGFKILIGIRKDRKFLVFKMRVLREFEVPFLPTSR